MNSPPASHLLSPTEGGLRVDQSVINGTGDEGGCTGTVINGTGDEEGCTETPYNSDVDISDDEETKSRDSGPNVDEKHSPTLSPSHGGLTLPPYPHLVGGLDRFHPHAPYPVMPNSLLQQSMMYMAHYMPQVPPFPGGLMGHGSLPEERRKRNRTFIDPVTEVPRLEQWFNHNTHPSHNLILKYTEELNRMPYRQKFPKLEPKNVQFWFKNRRAKCKRLRVSGDHVAIGITSYGAK
ncbi:hypothetical protein HAZT_HAZT011450 [Hyalella azteca]|nr:hypothetical protein HAZT_HAZT011450 [Hyalella azteca]